ncbi:MAG: serine/threonine protein kinase [Oscillospiraceae bacterium]
MQTEIIRSSERGMVELVGDTEKIIRRTAYSECAVFQTLKDNPSRFLPKIYSAEICCGKTVVCEEYIEGKSLAHTNVSEKQAVDIMIQLCSALEFIHSLGIVHRDIKPSNILLCKDGSIRLIDFEAARFVREDRDKDTRCLGTEGFAPPEQYGFSQTDFRSDIYAAGQTMKTLLGSLSAKPQYRRIILRCTSLDPDRRYQSASELKNALKNMGRKPYYIVAACAAVMAVCIAVTAGISRHTEDIPAVMAEEITDISWEDLAYNAIDSIYNYYGEEENIPEYNADDMIFFCEDKGAKILLAEGAALYGRFEKYVMYSDIDGDNVVEPVEVQVMPDGTLEVMFCYGVPADGVFRGIHCAEFVMPFEFDKSLLGEDTIVQVTSFELYGERLLAVTVGDSASYNFTGFFTVRDGETVFLGSAWGETKARISGVTLNEYLDGGGENVYIYAEGELTPVTAYDYGEYYTVDEYYDDFYG